MHWVLLMSSKGDLEESNKDARFGEGILHTRLHCVPGGKWWFVEGEGGEKKKGRHTREREREREQKRS